MPATTRITGRLARAGEVAEGWLEINSGTITAVEFGRAPPGTRKHEGLIAPGLCDLQVNGAAGVNVTDGAGALDAIDALQLDRGVTSYLPTIISTDETTAARAVEEIAERVGDPRSPVEGIHLEGPFLNRDFRGVHRAEFLAVPTDGEPAYYRSPAVRLVTLAPELSGARKLISVLHRRGVCVSIGHTGAGAQEGEDAEAQGAASITHLFNAMRPFHHRRPNVPVWALTASRAHLCVIPDGFHVDRLVLRLVDRLARRRVVLVTDASPAAGAPEGTFRMAGISIRASAGCVRDDRGGLAGSALTLDEGVRRWVALTAAPLAQALASASERPARLVGIKSGLRAGAPADLVLFDDEGGVERVMRRGSWVR